MYSDLFEGVDPLTLISLEVRVPATVGPGDVYPLHWYTYQAHPTCDLDPTRTYETFVFSTSQARQAWWKVVRKDRIWLRMPIENGHPCLPDRDWLDLTDDVTTQQEGSAA